MEINQAQIYIALFNSQKQKDNRFLFVSVKLAI